MFFFKGIQYCVCNYSSRDHIEVPEALQRVDLAESEYIASIMAVNGYTTEFQPEMEAKLKHFKVSVSRRPRGCVSASLQPCQKSLPRHDTVQCLEA